MNRNEEYKILLKELEETVPDMEPCITKAKRRKQRKQLFLRPLGGVAAAFAIFVLLVNYCAPVAYACSRIPVLRELAEAVTFSRSLSDAVENEYVQELNLSQTIDGITAEIPYLIVDQKQVNVFYRLRSETRGELSADPDVLTPDGEAAREHALSSWYAGDSGLLHIAIDYIDADVPDSLILRLRVQDIGSGIGEEEAPVQASDWESDAPTEPDYLVTFDFLLEFDPEFTAKGKILVVDKTVDLGGQKIVIETVEVYPTHLRLEVRDDPENTAWLKDLHFYIQTEDGKTFSSDISGITATGDGKDDSESMVSYRAESSYFYDAEQLSIVITGAQWLDKQRLQQKVHLDLITGECDFLPEGATFESAQRVGNGWEVVFRCAYIEDEPLYQNFGHLFYDQDGNGYTINRWSTRYGEKDEDGNFIDFLDTFPLANYPYDEVWLTPNFTHNWTAENPIVIPVQ